MTTTVLVANRGEIACRVLRSARALGLRTVAVCSDADRDAPHVAMADVAVRLGPAPAAESYLSVDAILDACDHSGADLVHPGYGFLSERAGFARAVADAGLVFVGPSPEAIAAMGDKAAALRLVEAAGVPVLSGHRGEAQDDATLLRAGEDLGAPLMVKAAAGGGGKGMRLVTDLADLPEALAAARREAASAFGDDTLLLERALVGPRHVEVQVLADDHGTVLALGERDCSVQRRHQKVVEEAPSPAVGPELRERMQAAAVAAARAVDYVGAGTVELLLAGASTDAPDEFAFLEMNTRIQVEHPVTEMVVRVAREPIDLVAWQLRIAMGESLPFTQDDVAFDGHGIEARLYAEDPAAGYLPQTGTVRRWSPRTDADMGAAARGDRDVAGLQPRRSRVLGQVGGTRGDSEVVRVDAGIVPGSEVTAHYDPMLAKVVAHGRDRDEARRRLAAALDETVLLGVTSNRTFLARVLRDPTFAAGEATTALLADAPALARPPSADLLDLALAAAWWHRHRTRDDTTPAELRGWTNAAWPAARQVLRTTDHEGEAVVADVRIRAERDGGLHVRAEPVDVDPDSSESKSGDSNGSDSAAPVELHLSAIGGVDLVRGPDAAGGRLVRLAALDGVELAPHRALVHLPWLDVDVTDLVLAPPAVDAERGEGVLHAPMHGQVTAVHVAEGQTVDIGDPLVVVEAMKMEHVVRADAAGVVTDLVADAAQVGPSTVVARIDPTG